MANLDIRQAAKRKRIAQWEIAEALGISESKLTRTLRHELEPKEAERILAIIEELSKKED